MTEAAQNAAYEEPMYPKSVPPLRDRDAAFMREEAPVYTGLRNAGFCYLHFAGENYWAVCGEVITGEDAHRGYAAPTGEPTPYALRCYRGLELLWERRLYDAAHQLSYGPYPNMVEISEKGEAIVTVCASRSEARKNGFAAAYGLRDGAPRWSYEAPTVFGGNGSVLAGDIDGDGRTELIFGLNGEIACLSADTGVRLWTFSGDEEGRVCICHGSPALWDVDGDGCSEIVFGTEYGTKGVENRSDLYVLSCEGKVKHALHGIMGDLGSTNTAAMQTEDGVRIAVGSLNLVYAKPRHNAALHCFGPDLSRIYAPADSCAGAFAAADTDGDGQAEACFVASPRDGGPDAARPAIRVIGLRDGRLLYSVPIPRAWLSTVPVAYDFNGDGLPEFLAGTWYGSGYGCFSDETFADLYIVDGSGSVLFNKTRPDGVYLPGLMSHDGTHVMLALPCYDGNVYFYSLPGSRDFNEFLCPAANTARTGEVRRG